MDLVSATAERQYNKVYLRAQALFDLASQPDFPDVKLASLIANLVTNFTGKHIQVKAISGLPSAAAPEAFRFRTFTLLSKAYSSLPLSLAQVYLGLPGDQVLKGR